MIGLILYLQTRRPVDAADVLRAVCFSVLVLFWSLGLLLLFCQACGFLLEQNQPEHWPLKLVVVSSVLLTIWLIAAWFQFKKTNTSYCIYRHSGSRLRHRRRYRVVIY
ncbi:MAG: hypothetical protein IT445_01045 [Phycisphaeraceae bacterium]|nr:hypothetical protein [Phycisphaeraceae bacterium]